MSMSRSRAATRAFQFGRFVAAMETAAALRGRADPEAIRKRRLKATKEIQERASVLANARRGSDAARRHGLALKERLIAHKQLRETRRLPPERVATQLREALSKKRPGADTDAVTTRGTRVHIETPASMDGAQVAEGLRQVLGFRTIDEMEQAGVRIDAPGSDGAGRRVFTIVLAIAPSSLAATGGDVAALVRSATGALRAAGVPRSPLPKFARRARSGSRVDGGGVNVPRERADRCCCGPCCCGCADTSPADANKPARPTWDSIPDDTEWHLKQMRVKDAWNLKSPPGGKSRGEGILIAHPDTGWREHDEFDEAQLRFDLARNVLDGRNGKAATRHGTLTIPPALFQTHGTGTGGVIVSAEATGQTHVSDVPFDKMIATSSDVQLTGVAPKAQLAPIRCTDGVVLLMDTNIHKAIEHAIDIGAHVISISLGGVLDAAAERLIDRAVVDHNIIVVAAAGQIVHTGTNSVIEPANFTNVVAVAGSTPAAAPWSESCRGPKVAVSAPAQGVWFPNFFLDGTPGIYWGEGTSFAAAQVASVAALWLAHWGRDALIDRYRGVPLAHVFRQLLRKTAWKPRRWDALFGAGIVDAYALLSEPLPARADIVAPGDSDEFNLFDAVSDFVDMGGAIAGEIWNGAVEAGGAVGDLFSELLVLTGLSEGLAVVGDLAATGSSEARQWADEQIGILTGFVDDSLQAAGDAWDDAAAGGEEVVETVGDLIEEGGELLEDISDGAVEAADQAVDFLVSLWP